MEENNHEVSGATDAPGETPQTGDDQVDAALTALHGLNELPVHGHPDVIDAAHRVLQDRLAADEQADSGQGG